MSYRDQEEMRAAIQRAIARGQWLTCAAATIIVLMVAVAIVGLAVLLLRLP